jgi:hypothetical protein
MIKPRRYLVPFKLLLLLVLSSAQDAPRTQDKRENEAKSPSLGAQPTPPTHSTPLSLPTDPNADKQGFLGPAGGWYENGLGSNFHSDYPYPRDPYQADSQFWPDYGWDQRHDFPYVWVGKKEAKEKEESSGGVEAGIDNEDPSTVSKHREEGKAKEAMTVAGEQQIQNKNMDDAEQDADDKQLEEKSLVTEAAAERVALAAVEIEKEVGEPVAMDGKEPNGTEKVNKKSMVTATDPIPNGNNDQAQVDTEQVGRGEEGVAVPTVVADKDKQASVEGGSVVVVAIPVEEVKTEGAGESAVVIGKQFYNGGYGDSYYGDGYFNAYWRKGRKGGGISFGGSSYGGSGYAPYYGYGGEPGYGQGYGGPGYGSYGGPGYGNYGGGCCRRLRGSLRRA